MKRSSGILMPISSLPSEYGIGSFGRSAYDFIDFLHSSGQSWWQLLPIGTAGAGNSPYSSFSTYAGNPNYIDLDVLVEEGLLNASDLEKTVWGSNLESVDYELINSGRPEVLKKAYLTGKEKYASEIESFRSNNSAWLDDYALYMSAKEYFGGKAWYDWPDAGLRMGNAEAKRSYSLLLFDSIEFIIFCQYIFFRQWNALRVYAKEKGIGFIGDIPIYVPLDSADVWSEPHFFCLDDEFKPVSVAGCPPDFFNDEGQLWGNPLYDWDAMKNDGYGWWIRRIGHASMLYDIIRIDHFRGLSSYWSVPADSENAINGHWCKGPGMDLVGVLTSWFNDTKFIAEDLGDLTPDVFELLKESGLPGMKVLHFAFDPESDSLYLPHNCGEKSVLYIGTHDNNTTLGWLEDISPEEKEYAADYMRIREGESWCRALIRTGMSCCSELFIMQMQDILELDASARMNTPGIPNGNWRWRMKPGAADEKLAGELYGITKTYRRI